MQFHSRNRCSFISQFNTSRRVRLAIAGAIFAATGGLAQATIYSPYSFTSLGTLNPTNSTVNINTNTGVITVGSTTYTGVIDNQGGQAGINGTPSVAIFDFNSIALDSTDTVTVTGSNGLALLSLGNANISTLTLAGASGTNGVSGSASTAPGGSGIAGGYAGGAGGFPSLQYTEYDGTGIGSKPGSGPGAGQTAGTNGLYNGDSGGGGGFGGAGGSGKGGENINGALNANGGAGGFAYGFSVPLGTFTPLSAGSGGGGGNYDNEQVVNNDPKATSTGGGGGAGGGAVEIVAMGIISLSTLNANGGNGGLGGGYAGAGGGGSGGDVILVANRVNATTVSANGGTSPGDTYGNSDAGGAGGGGRMIIQTDGPTPSGTYTVNGGANPYPGNANYNGYGGGNGTLSELTGAYTAPNVTINARRGAGSVTANLTFTNSGSSGSVVFGEFTNSQSVTHLTGIPASGNNFALDTFTPSVSYPLTYTPVSTDNPQTINLAFNSNVDGIRPTVTVNPVGPQFSSGPGAGSTINFGTIDIGTSKTINLTLRNSSNNLGGNDTSSLTQLDITGYSLLTSVNGSAVTSSVFTPQSMPNGPIYEGGSYVVPIIFTPNDNVTTSEVLQIDTDVNGPVGITTTSYNFTFIGTGQNPLLGDDNYDGIVNNSDLQILLNGETKSLTGWSNGDFNQDGVINADDFALYAKGLAEYNASLPTAPEPLGMACLLPLTWLATTRHRRQWSTAR